MNVARIPVDGPFVPLRFSFEPVADIAMHTGTGVVTTNTADIANTAVPTAPEFVPARTFLGARPVAYFTTREFGLVYYNNNCN